VLEATLEVDLASLSAGAAWREGDAVSPELDDFRAQFVGEVAAVLGVPAARVRVVGIRSGSVRRGPPPLTIVRKTPSWPRSWANFSLF
jgi:hypothetical protein